MEEVDISPEEIFVHNHLKTFVEAETTIKKLKRRVSSETQSYINSLDGTKKLIDAFKEYATLLSGVIEMKDLGDIFMQVASAHSILEQMNTQINDMLRNKVLSALKNAIKEFKQCKELKNRLQQHRSDYESTLKLFNSKDVKDKDKTKQSLTETKIKWEAAAEGGMTKVRCAVQNHNVLISEGLVSLLDTYRINFIKCQEYIETIQPQINQYLTFADNRRFEKESSEKSRNKNPAAENVNKEKEPIRATRKIGIPKRFKGSVPGSNNRKLDKKLSSTTEIEPTEDSTQSIGLHRARGFHSHSDLSGMADKDYNSSFENDDQEDSDTIIYFTDPNTNLREVRAATLQQLVSRLTNPSVPDPPFRTTFFLTYREFATPNQLLELIIQVYFDNQTITNKLYQLRSLSSIKYWIENHPYDFVDNPELRESIAKFFNKHVRVPSPTAYKQIMQQLEKITQQPPAAIASVSIPPSSPSIVRMGVTRSNTNEPSTSSPSFSIDSYDPLDIAKQLTLIESKLFCSITPSECLNKNWSSENKEKLSPHIIGITEQFNRTSRWIVMEVITKYQLKARVDALRRVIQLLQHLRDLNNFNGVMEVLAGVNSSPVRRLKLTWKEMTETERRIVEDNERLMNHKSSYRTYRSTLHSSSTPIIPFLGVYLTDLTFIEDGNPNYISGLINFSKCQKIASVISEIVRYQVPYKQLQDKPFIQNCLRQIIPIEEEEAYTISIRIEPRDPSEAFENLLLEEDRYKKYIAELQVRIADLEGLQKKQSNTVSLLSDQVKSQHKTIQNFEKIIKNATAKYMGPSVDSLRRSCMSPNVTQKSSQPPDQNTSQPKTQGEPTPKPKVTLAIALFDFKAENADELPFKKGDKIKILSKDSGIAGDGWWAGEANGNQGVFPIEYVSELKL